MILTALRALTPGVCATRRHVLALDSVVSEAVWFSMLMRARPTSASQLTGLASAAQSSKRESLRAFATPFHSVEISMNTDTCGDAQDTSVIDTGDTKAEYPAWKFEDVVA